MDRYIIRGTSHEAARNINTDIGASSGKRARTDINRASDDFVSDPALRKPIDDYEPAIRDDMRRQYVQMGPCSQQ